MSTEIVVADKSKLAAPDSDESVARIEAMADQLPSLIDAGDTETIKQWRDEGQAAALAAKKLGYDREARVLARQSIRCAASLGIIEVRRDEWNASRSALAAALDRGRLEQVMDDAGSHYSEERVARSAIRLGCTRIPRRRFAALIRKYVAERQTTLAEVSREHGWSLHAEQHPQPLNSEDGVGRVVGV